MGDNKPNVIITEGHSDAIRLLEKIHRNSYYPVTPTPYLVFHDPSVAEKIVEEAHIQSRNFENIANHLIVVSDVVGKHFLHHPMPTGVPNLARLYDELEDKMTPNRKIIEKFFEKDLDLSDIVVSLQSNNQKD